MPKETQAIELCNCVVILKIEERTSKNGYLYTHLRLETEKGDVIYSNIVQPAEELRLLKAGILKL